MKKAFGVNRDDAFDDWHSSSSDNLHHMTFSNSGIPSLRIFHGRPDKGYINVVYELDSTVNGLRRHIVKDDIGVLSKNRSERMPEVIPSAVYLGMLSQLLELVPTISDSEVIGD